MKKMQRFFAVMLAAVLTVTVFAGCHQKNAVVASYTADGKTYELTSGEYAFAMILAESEGRNLVSEELSENEEDTTDIDFYKQTYENKKFADWVVDRAEELCRQYFQVAASFDKYELELSESERSTMESYLSYQWQLSGYQYICEPNGVSYDSFLSFQEVFSYKRNALLKYLYGTDGPKAVGDEELTKALTDNFALADTIQVDSTELTEETSEEALSAAAQQAKAQLQGYADRLNAGESFETIYKEHNPEEETEQAEAETDEDEGEEEETLEPLDKLATLYGSEDTSAANDLFEQVSGCEVGVATVLEGDDGVYTLVFRQDLTADPYYAENYTNEVLYILKNDEFSEDLDEEGAKLDVKFNSYERNYIKPKKIDYSEYEAYISSVHSSYGY